MNSSEAIMNKDYKAKFMDVYANLPINIRREIISIVDNQPISWNIAYIEIKNDTELGKKILKNIIDLGIL